jgi:hypothetical protein
MFIFCPFFRLLFAPQPKDPLWAWIKGCLSAYAALLLLLLLLRNRPQRGGFFRFADRRGEGYLKGRRTPLFPALRTPLPLGSFAIEGAASSPKDSVSPLGTLRSKRVKGAAKQGCVPPKGLLLPFGCEAGSEKVVASLASQPKGAASQKEPLRG